MVRRRVAVSLRVPSAQVRREELKRDEDPCHSVRERRGEQVGEGGERSARTRQAQTTTERLRRQGARRHEDARFGVGSSNPLADLSHVIGECLGTPNRYNVLQDLPFAIQDVRDVVPLQAGVIHRSLET